MTAGQDVVARPERVGPAELGRRRQRSSVQLQQQLELRALRAAPSRPLGRVVASRVVLVAAAHLTTDRSLLIPRIV